MGFLPTVAGALLALALGLAVAPAQAQVTVQSVLAPNYDRIPIGNIGGLEGGAFTARADDASAAWYNPAGLVKSNRDSISGNASIFENIETTFGRDATTVSASIPSFVGFKRGTAGGRFAWAFSLVTPIHFETGVSSEVEGIPVQVNTFIDVAGEIQPVNFSADSVNAAFDSASKFSMLSPGLSLGWALAESFRVGVGVRYHRITFDVVDSSSLRQLPGAGGNFSNYLRTSETTWNAKADLLTYELGLQWDLAERFTMGVVMRTASSLQSGSSDFSFNSIESFSRDLDGDGVADTVQVVDTQVSSEGEAFEFRLPRELDLGFAYLGDTVEWEIDVRRHDAINAFEMFAGGGIVIIDSRNHAGAATGDGGGLAPLQYSAEEVTNISMGIKIKASEGFWLHAGAFQDNSPVGATNDIFDRIDLVGYTVGGTLVGKNTVSSLGFVQTSGEDPGETGVPAVEIKTTAITLATTFFFSGGSAGSVDSVDPAQ